MKSSEAEHTAREALTLAAQTAQFGVHDYDPATNRSLWSPELCAILGMPADSEITLETAIALIHPDDRARISRKMQAALDPHGTGEFNEEFRICRADNGAVRWVANRARTLFAAHGAARRPVRNTGIIQDITDRKHAEQALRSSRETVEQQLQAIESVYRTAPVGLGYVDQDLRYMRVNAALADINGVPAEDHVGRTVRDVLGTALADKVEPFYLRVLKTGKPILNVELSGETASQPGVERFWLAHYDPLHGSDGSVIGVNAVVQEITERKLAQAALDRQREQYAALVNASAQIVWTCTPEGFVEEDSPTWRQFTGQTFDEVKGSGWLHAVYPDDRERARGEWRTAVSSGAYHCEYRLRHRSGEWRHMLVRGVPLNLGGKVLSWVGMSTDVTEQKFAEGVLQKTERLAAAGQLASSLAHEINNPLAAITNALYLLEHRCQLDELGSQYVSTAATELARVSRIVKQCLSYYRIDTLPRPLNLSELVEESLRIFEGRRLQANVHLVQNIEPRAIIVGFADELRQVIDNLLINALEAMPSDGTLRVCVRSSLNWSDGRSGARLTIADSGIGIRRENLGKIFQPFFTTKSDKGTGLGTWVVQGIVAKHEGTLRLRSSQEPSRRGTTVSVFLPAQSRAPRQRIAV